MTHFKCFQQCCNELYRFSNSYQDFLCTFTESWSCFLIGKWVSNFTQLPLLRSSPASKSNKRTYWIPFAHWVSTCSMAYIASLMSWLHAGRSLRSQKSIWEDSTSLWFTSLEGNLGFWKTLPTGKPGFAYNGAPCAVSVYKEEKASLP